ncbi:hypothetical protein I6H07_14010 [Hafnia alvei]|uniref:hypothetical protein n=1 Tax=Hafnia alvei TaxID=569 RepID=UPI000B762664|nr:hypothetical protein [Hafnia alvei]MBI0276892.1 hypothetical protein [Hafnia alvei]PNK99931.1 hypothetical protein CEQ28_021245 [Hafnia alvei]
MTSNSKERGMIFNSEMVRAILSGQKTQTRRIVKCDFQEIAGRDDGSLWPWREDCEHAEDYWYPCHHGNVGDRIWVRETWAALGNEDGCSIDWNENLVKEGGAAGARIYRASCEQKEGDYGLWSIPDDAEWKPHTDNMKYEGTWVPSIHMPRWASRILLEITNVHVERLNDISEEDARSEGITPKSLPAEKLVGGKLAFAELWASIYGYESWQSNPWVWVIEFKRVQEQSND